MSSLAQWFRDHVDDYKQLKDAYPNANRFGSTLKDALSKQVPTTQDFQSPKKLSEWSQAAALNAPMGLMFVGPKATGWNHEAANTATKLLDEGADPAQVWKEHLIGRMPDKSLFSEIDDSEAYIEHAGANAPKDAHTLQHEDLFSEYPTLAKYQQALSLSNPAKGSFSDKTIVAGGGGHLNELKSIANHEFQHAIQDIEGWARGGSQNGAYQSNERNILAHELAKKNSTPSLDSSNPYSEGAYVPSYEEALKNAYEYIDSSSGRLRTYRRLTGEAQARSTQDRMNLNMQQRRESYPLAGDKLSDIPLKDLISRYR